MLISTSAVTGFVSFSAFGSRSSEAGSNISSIAAGKVNYKENKVERK